MADKSVAFRLSLKDGELVRAALERLGKDGEAAIKKIDRAAKDAGSGGLSTLDRAIGRIGVAAAGLASGLSAGLFLNWAKNAIDTAGGLGELAQQIGVTTDQLQIYQYAASQAGVKQEEFETSLQKLSRALGDAVEGSDAAIDAFQKLGIKVLDSAGKARTTGAIFEDVVRAISDMDDPARQASAAFDIFGKTGQRLLPILSAGAAGLREMEQRARSLGLVYSSDLIAGADKAADKMAEFDLVWQKFSRNLVISAVPAINEVLAAFDRMLTRVNDPARKIVALNGELLRTQAEIAKLESEIPSIQDDFLRRAGNATLGQLPGGKILPNAAQEEARKRLEELRRQEAEQRKAVEALIEEQRKLAEKLEEERRKGASGGGTGAADPRRKSEIEAEQKLQEQYKKTTAELAAQADQYGRAGKARAVYEAVARAGLDASQQEVETARKLVATYPEIASQRQKDIANLAQQAEKTYEAAEADKARTEAQREGEQQQKRLSEAQKKAYESLDEMVASLAEEQRQLTMSDKERFVRQKLLEAEPHALKLSTEAAQKYREEIERQAGAFFDLKEATDDAKKQREEFQREAEKRAEEQRELLLEPYREAWRSIQQLGADAIEQLFDGGLKNAKDFWKSFLDIAKKALIQIASAEITVAIQGVFSTSGAPGGQGGISGLLGQIFGGGSSPVAGTGNLPGSSGGGLGGGLFGSGSIGSYLSQPLSAVFGSSGAAYGYNTGMLFPGESAMQGASYASGMLGGLSLGQGLGALGGAATGITQLLQGGTANTIGGITSLIGAGVSLIPGVGQILGPIISMAGPIIGSLFGKKPKKFPNSRFRLLTTGGDTSMFEPGGSPTVTSPFGTIGYHSDGSNERFVEGDAASPFLQTLADIDNAIADLLTPEQIGLVSAALNGVGGRRESFRDDPNGREFFAATEDRLASMLRALYGSDVASQGFSGIARSDENIEQLAERAVDIISLKNAIADFGKASTDAEDAVRAIQKQFAEMKADAEAWGFSDADIAAIEAERKRTLNALAGDINKNIADALLGFSDPYALAQQQLAEAQDTRRQEALYLIQQYEEGVLDTLVDINKLEELFGKERAALAEQALEAIGASWQGFVDELTFGPLSAKSNREQYNLALAEYDDVRARAQAAFAANDNLDPALAAEFQNEARLALQWSRTFNASSAATASLYQQILDLAGQFGDLDIPGFAGPSNIPGFAGGGVAGPGLIEVGERGREFIRLFQPARVYSNGESNAMLSGNGQGIEKLTEMFEYMSRLFAGGQSQMLQRLGQLLEQFIAARRDAELRGATAAATTPPGPVGVSRIAARR